MYRSLFPSLDCMAICMSAETGSKDIGWGVSALVLLGTYL
jgi:hypothetical protein